MDNHIDDSLRQVVLNYPIEALILWSKLHYPGENNLSRWDENFSKLQVVRVYYTALALSNFEAMRLYQKDDGDVFAETSCNFGEFSQYLLLDGDYHGKTYMPSLLELSRLSLRHYIVKSQNIKDVSGFNEFSKKLKIPNELKEYICLREVEINNSNDM